MSSHARSSREQERRFSIHTLLIASAASAMAAIITSQFWTSGTPIAAAVTPVIVTLVSELLRRPTERIAGRFTTEMNALPPEAGARPGAAGAGPPPRNEEHEPRPAGGRPDFEVHQTRFAARRLPWKPILATATIAFLLAAAVLTLPELIAGQSVGKGNSNFTLWGGRSRAAKKQAPAETEQTQTEQTESTPTQTDPARTQPEQTTPKAKPKPKEATPAAPKPAKPPTQSTPAPVAPPSAPQEQP